MNTEPLPSPPPCGPVHKCQGENKHIESDRLELLKVANDFVSRMHTRTVAYYLSDRIGAEPCEMTPHEVAAYNGALRLLRECFMQGPRTAYDAPTKYELEYLAPKEPQSDGPKPQSTSPSEPST